MTLLEYVKTNHFIEVSYYQKPINYKIDENVRLKDFGFSQRTTIIKYLEDVSYDCTPDFEDFDIQEYEKDAKRHGLDKIELNEQNENYQIYIDRNEENLYIIHSDYEYTEIAEKELSEYESLEYIIKENHLAKFDKEI